MDKKQKKQGTYVILMFGLFCVYSDYLTRSLHNIDVLLTFY